MSYLTVGKTDGRSRRRLESDLQAAYIGIEQRNEELGKQEARINELERSLSAPFTRHPDGSVTLTMSADDFDTLLIALGYRAGGPLADRPFWLGVVNRINRGNPNFTPYGLPDRANATPPATGSDEEGAKL